MDLSNNQSESQIDSQPVSQSINHKRKKSIC